MQEQAKEREAVREQSSEQKKEDLRERLDANKKKLKNRINTITRVMTAMNNRRQNAFDRITKVSDAVQAFYKEGTERREL